MEHCIKSGSVLTWSHAAKEARASGNLDNDFNANYLVAKANESQALDDVTALSTLKLLREQKYDKLFQLILVPIAIVPSSGFNEGENESLCPRRPTIRGLQMIVTLYSLQRRSYTMPHHRKLSEHLGVTGMHATLLWTY